MVRGFSTNHVLPLRRRSTKNHLLFVRRDLTLVSSCTIMSDLLIGNPIMLTAVSLLWRSMNPNEEHPSRNRIFDALIPTLAVKSTPKDEVRSTIANGSAFWYIHFSNTNVYLFVLSRDVTRDRVNVRPYVPHCRCEEYRRSGDTLTGLYTIFVTAITFSVK